MMLVGHSDLVMRQEQYHDLLREAKQERFIRANGLGRSSGQALLWKLAQMVRAKLAKPQQSPQLKRATL
jgi:hypothetical protein